MIDYSISIHAPLAGRDRIALLDCPNSVAISIHAPLAGRDTRIAVEGFTPKLFQSTRPLRGATAAAGTVSVTAQFQSTRPLRGATVKTPLS